MCTKSPQTVAVFRVPNSNGKGGKRRGDERMGRGDEREGGSSSFALGRKRKVGAYAFLSLGERRTIGVTQLFPEF